MVNLQSCRFCNSRSSLIKAHIIPEAFFRRLRDHDRPPLLVSGRAGQMPRRSPIGVYDKGILCSGCEKQFLSMDSYGTDVILNRFQKYFSPIHIDGKIPALRSDTLDTNMMLRFLLSLLWRASVSSQPFYSQVLLGPYEDETLELLKQPGISIPSAFDAVLSRWDEAGADHLPSRGILNPYRERWDGVNTYRFYLGEIVAYIKVDKRPFDKPFSMLSLQHGAPFHVISRSLAASSDLLAIRRTVQISAGNKRVFTSA